MCRLSILIMLADLELQNYHLYATYQHLWLHLLDAIGPFRVH